MTTKLIRLLAALSLLPLTALCQGNVQFDYANIVGQTGVHLVTLRPVGAPWNAGGKIIPRDTVSTVTDSNGSVTVSNLVGGFYESDYHGNGNTITTNYFLFPYITGTLYATNYFTTVIPGNQLAWAYSASTLQFRTNLTSTTNSGVVYVDAAGLDVDAVAAMLAILSNNIAGLVGSNFSGVVSFNTRTGLVTLNSSDVTSAIGYAPLSNTQSGVTLSGTFSGDGSGMTGINSNGLDGPTKAQLALAGTGGGTSVTASAPLTAATNSGVVTIGGTNLATLSDIAVTGYSLDSFGAKHDARRLVGAVNSGSATVTLSVGTVSASDIGDMVKVRLGTSSSQDMGTASGVPVTIVSTNGPTSFVLSRTCGNSLAAAEIMVAKTDDTAAIQAGINALAYGGGTLLASPGLYWINGPIIDPGNHTTHTNSQIYIPPLYTSYGVQRVIVFQGAGEGQAYGVGTGNMAVATNVTMFVCGLETGDGGAMFGGAPILTGHFAGGVEFRNCAFRMPSNPNCTAAIDGHSYSSLIIRGAYFDTGGYQEYDANLSAPAYDSCAAWFPESNNPGGGRTRLESTDIMGAWYAGLKYSEHLTVVNCAILDCLNALVPDNAPSDVTMFNLAIEGCPNVLFLTNGAAAATVINNMHYENASPLSWAQSHTLINDAGNRMVGYARGDFIGATNIGAGLFDTSVLAGSYPTTNVWNSINRFGNLDLEPTPDTSISSYPGILSMTFNKGILFAPTNTVPGSFTMFMSNQKNGAVAGVPNFLMRLPADGSEVTLETETGGNVGGRPIRLYPYFPNGWALSVETNGSVVAGTGPFVGNGSGVTNVPASSVNTNGGYGVFGTGTFSAAGGGGGSPPTFSSQFSQDWNGTHTNLASGVQITNPVVTGTINNVFSGGYSNVSKLGEIDVNGDADIAPTIWMNIPVDGISGNIGMGETYMTFTISGGATGFNFSGGPITGIGSGLTALNPANIAAGTAAISISGTSSISGLAYGLTTSNLVSISTPLTNRNAFYVGTNSIAGTNVVQIDAPNVNNALSIGTNGTVNVQTKEQYGGDPASGWNFTTSGRVDSLGDVRVVAGKSLKLDNIVNGLGGSTPLIISWSGSGEGSRHLLFQGSGFGVADFSSNVVSVASLAATNSITLQGTNAAPTGVTWGVTVPDLWLTVTNNGVQGFVPWFKNH